SRAGIAPQRHEDCTQSVYLTLLERWGRARFDGAMGAIGRMGLRDVLSRETADGPDFFRAIDAVKKRALRERHVPPLESIEAVAAPGEDSVQAQRRSALLEEVDRSLSPREATLVDATLNGETLDEIAQDWGVSSKTVSNIKTQAIRKLRGVLGSE